MTVTQTIPVLRIFDEVLAREFYVDFLGMTVDWEHRFEPGLPLYMQVSRGGFVLHLSGHFGDACPGANMFLRVTGLRMFHAELLSKNHKHCRPGLETTFHDSIAIKVGDPFGNKLQFDESLSPG